MKKFTNLSCNVSLTFWKMCQEQFMNEESRETRMQSIQIGNHSGIYNQVQEAKESFALPD